MTNGPSTPSIRGRLTGILYAGRPFVPARLLLGTLLQYPWQRASRLPCAGLLDERWHPRAALEISLWHPTPSPTQKSQSPRGCAREDTLTKSDAVTRTALHSPAPSPAWLIVGPEHTPQDAERQGKISPARLSEQLEHNAGTRWLIATPDIPLSSVNVNTIALVPHPVSRITLQPRKTRLTFHRAAFCALY